MGVLWQERRARFSHRARRMIHRDRHHRERRARPPCCESRAPNCVGPQPGGSWLSEHQDFDPPPRRPLGPDLGGVAGPSLRAPPPDQPPGSAGREHTNRVVVT